MSFNSCIRHAQLAAELHEFSGSLSRPSAGQRNKDFIQGMISFCQGLFSTPAFASLCLALEMTSLQHQDLGSCCPTAKLGEGRFQPHKGRQSWGESLYLVHSYGKKWGFKPWPEPEFLPQTRCTVFLCANPHGRWSPCCPAGLNFILSHACSAEITAVKHFH